MSFVKLPQISDEISTDVIRQPCVCQLRQRLGLRTLDQLQNGRAFNSFENSRRKFEAKDNFRDSAAIFAWSCSRVAVETPLLPPCPYRMLLRTFVAAARINEASLEEGPQFHGYEASIPLSPSNNTGDLDLHRYCGGVRCSADRKHSSLAIRYAL